MQRKILRTIAVTGFALACRARRDVAGAGTGRQSTVSEHGSA